MSNIIVFNNTGKAKIKGFKFDDGSVCEPRELLDGRFCIDERTYEKNLGFFESKKFKKSRKEVIEFSNDLFPIPND